MSGIRHANLEGLSCSLQGAPRGTVPKEPHRILRSTEKYLGILGIPINPIIVVSIFFSIIPIEPLYNPT